MTYIYCNKILLCCNMIVKMQPIKAPPKPVSHVTPVTSGSEGVYMPLGMTRSRQHEEDHYMQLCGGSSARG